MTYIIYIAEALLLAYLAWGVLYQLFYALAGLGWQAPVWPTAARQRNILVLIPAYREDAVIVNTARVATQQNYPAGSFEVIVIADSLKTETLAALRAIPVRVEEVHFETSTKSKSLNACLDRLPKDAHEITVLLDGDNLMEPDFLQRVNAAFATGVRVLQGRRVAKNSDTTMAILDGLSEDINNHILCAGHARLGLSARLAGSGMAFDALLFRETMREIDAIGGFDKELELRLTKAGERVFYDPKAMVLDEKVRKGDHFARQRSRWIAAQFHYGGQFFPAALAAWLRKGNFDHFNKASQMLLPPRLLTPGILGMGTVLWALVGWWGLAAAWLLVLVLNLTTFLVAMPAYAWQSPYRDALLRVPLAFWHALRSLIGLRKANQQFIHTPHGEADVKS
jgi:cellulose synthase/poly-beta-1,6-N-acetylglucosamine synthase-like glycosyltransferase